MVTTVMNAEASLENQTDRSAKRTLRLLQKKLGYDFVDDGLLRSALCHRSFTQPKKPHNHRVKRRQIAAGKAETEAPLPRPAPRLSLDDPAPLAAASHNERLEFLGDSVLNLVIGHYLMERTEGYSEGLLSKIRASLVNEKALATLARRLQLQKHLYLGRAEERSGGREKSSILADSLEAIFGAIYLDGGLEAARSTILAVYGEVLTENLAKRISFDYKTLLQEKTQELFKCIPQYSVVKSIGPDHEKVFSVVINIPGMPEISGEGSSIKEASQAAARIACEAISSGFPAAGGAQA